MVGAGTVRAERYGRIVRGRVAPAAAARARAERGAARLHRLRPPVAAARTSRCSPSRHAQVVIVTAVGGEPARERRRRRLRPRRARRRGSTLPRALAELRERFGVRTLLCEGGPHLNRSCSPPGSSTSCSCRSPRSSAGGDPTAGERAADPRRRGARAAGRARAARVLESDSHLFLRYGVRASAPERVSRETTLEQLAGQLTPFRGDARRRCDAHHDLLAVELLERDPRRIAQRRLQGASRAAPAGRSASCPGAAARAGSPPRARAAAATATLSTTLLGTRIESSPVANVVYSSPSELTVPSSWPASGPPCRRTRSPTRNGRALSRTVPAIRLPSVCCAARPRITAVNAPPSASVRASMPATRSATISASTTVEQADQEADRAGRGRVQAPEQRRSERRDRRRARSPSRGSPARSPSRSGPAFRAPVRAYFVRRAVPSDWCRAGSRGVS